MDYGDTVIPRLSLSRIMRIRSYAIFKSVDSSFVFVWRMTLVDTSVSWLANVAKLMVFKGGSGERIFKEFATRSHNISTPKKCLEKNVPLEIVRSSGHEKVPTRGKPGLERPGRPRGEKIVWQALVDPTVTRSTIRANVGVTIVPHTIPRHLAEANLKSKHPFRALPLTPEHQQLRLEWCQA
ncbi:HTH_Tnp_Tc3_2 domain-containing protein [Trichonephila clavipes]|nr:HTH_Tnp_Tc3_2 domain-containing protein [Trichonephila clavipes]